MLLTRHCGFDRSPVRLSISNKPTLLAVFLGLAAFSSAALAQEQPISGGLSSGLDINTQARFQIWRRTTLGSYKGVDAYRDALDAAKIKIGVAADEILGRPAFPYVSGKMDVELTVVSAAELGVEFRICSSRRLQPCKTTWSGVVPGRGGTAVAAGLSRSATRRISHCRDGAGKHLQWRADDLVASELGYRSRALGW